jgi:transketolase
MENNELKRLALEVRKNIVRAVYFARSGHPGGSLGAADILTYLYFEEMKNLDPKNPRKNDRDRFVLSKGHCSPALYSVLALKGFFPVEDLVTFRHTGSYLQGHPNMNETPGIDMSTGSLGQGVSAAVGMALAGKLTHKGYHVYTLLGDGECEEGEVWEAAMFAGNRHLDNLTVIVDWNGLQIDGKIEEVNSPLPFNKKFEAYHFKVFQVEDGNDFTQLRNVFMQSRKVKDMPVAIICRTIKGKGVSYMENSVEWHGKAPNEEQYKIAMEELRKAGESL